ncbi:alpha/beta hydrolase fold-1 [Tanacetum coccineum]
MSSCVTPIVQESANPIVLLHVCVMFKPTIQIKWRYTLPLLEHAGLEAWAVDILGWGFNNLVLEVLHQKAYVVSALVGPSLGAVLAIDFAINHPEAVSLLKSLPLRFYATNITFNDLPLSTCLEWTYITRLHCLLPWSEEATVDFMSSGGYNVSAQINQVFLILRCLYAFRILHFVETETVNISSQKPKSVTFAGVHIDF